jgi:hypothetical protein
VKDEPKFTLMIACFVIPNEAIEPNKPLIEFLKPVRFVEQWSGLTMFPHLRRDGVLLDDHWEAPREDVANIAQPHEVKPLCEHVECDLSQARWNAAKSKL